MLSRFTRAVYIDGKCVYNCLPCNSRLAAARPACNHLGAHNRPVMRLPCYLAIPSKCAALIMCNHRRCRRACSFRSYTSSLRQRLLHVHAKIAAFGAGSDPLSRRACKKPSPSTDIIHIHLMRMQCCKNPADVVFGPLSRMLLLPPDAFNPQLLQRWPRRRCCAACMPSATKTARRRRSSIAHRINQLRSGLDEDWGLLRGSTPLVAPR